ncbi:hypothetical protein ACFPC0_19740 [Streptomyces andamanensis]|uniref:Secreted protein n=1 Tax=Streptomyces andamanensis TaxID=1565035 RepID=A0ABV8TH74_9ACTN
MLIGGLSAIAMGAAVLPSSASAAPENSAHTATVLQKATHPTPATSTIRQQASNSAAKGQALASYAVGCYAKATKPFTVTRSSRDIHGEAELTSCFGKPDSCHLGVDLEQYNGRIHRWHVVAHNGGSWKACKIGKPVNATYKNCHHDNSTRWYYRSSIYLVVEKNGRTGNVGHAYSKGNLFWCS